MRIVLAVVGKPGRVLGGPIREYEERAGRYWKLDVATVKAEPATRGKPMDAVRASEGERLRGAIDASSELIVLTRGGTRWSSERLAGHLENRAIRAAGDVALVIGGAFGLDPTLIDSAGHRLSLSAMTLPHDLARLVLAEQLYRAGTIVRGEPYHKG